MTKKVRKPLGIKYVEKSITIGEIMRNRRLELGLLQKDVAVQFNATEESITNWENGHSELQVRYYPKLISFLGYYPFDHEVKTMGGQIRKYRYVKGLSHKQLAKQINIDESTISRWESNKCSPHLKIKKVILSFIKNEIHKYDRVTKLY